MLPDFYSVSDHFGTVCFKGLKVRKGCSVKHIQGFAFRCKYINSKSSTFSPGFFPANVDLKARIQRNWESSGREEMPMIEAIIEALSTLSEEMFPRLYGQTKFKMN